MLINPKVKNLIPINNLEDVYVVADFDWTITDSNSELSWEMLGASKYVPSSYKKEKQELFDYYYPRVFSDSSDSKTKVALAREWYEKHIGLYIKYKLSEDIFTEAAKNKEFMRPRTYVIEFMKFLHENNIPLIIFSGGVGNFIEKFLENYNCYYDNITIISNMFEFKDGIAIGLKNDVIHTYNKNESSIPKNITDRLNNRNTVILIGDHIGDVAMVDSSKHKSVIKIGISTPEISKEVLSNHYDIVLDENESYKDILNYLFK